MKRKEKTVGARSKENIGIERLNSTELTGVKTGQKLQVTVRLEAETIQSIEDIQEQTGCSFAEAVRRIVRRGLFSKLQRLGDRD